jgi:hypothetical protein
MGNIYDKQYFLQRGQLNEHHEKRFEFSTSARFHAN